MTQYGNIVFTKHALERMDLRIVTQDMVLDAIHKPNKTFTQPNGDLKFIAKVRGCKIHAVCKPLPEENKLLVISVWVRGEDDQGNQVHYTNNYRGRERSSSDRLFAGLSTLILMGILLLILYLGTR